MTSPINSMNSASSPTSVPSFQREEDKNKAVVQTAALSVLPDYLSQQVAASEGWMAWGWKKVKNVGVKMGVSAIKTIYASFDKQKVISEQEAEMRRLGDPEFIEFYKFVNALLVPTLEERVFKPLQEEKDALSQEILSNQSFILNMIEVILARGFVNLSRQAPVRQVGQPFLVNIILFVCEKAGGHISLAELRKIEEDHRLHHIDLQNQVSSLFSVIENDPVRQGDLQQYIQEYIKANDQAKWMQIVIFKYPNFEFETSQEQAQMLSSLQPLSQTLDALQQDNLKLHQIFSQVADAILLCLFPNKLADIPEINGLLSKCFEGTIFNALKNTITDLLQDLYEPLGDNATRNNLWKDDLQKRFGSESAPNLDLQPVIEAPAALLVAFAKNYIQTNTDVIKQQTIKFLDHSVSKNSQQESIENQPSQEQLATWIVKTVQVILDKPDPKLQGLGEFIRCALNNLTLALMAKTTELIIPQDHQVTSEAFLKEFGECIVEKFRLAPGDAFISEVFWKDFVKDLPIPSMIKDFLPLILMKKAEELHSVLTHNVSHFQEFYNKNREIIVNYKEGEKLLSITEKVSDQLVKQVFEKNVGLVASFGLGDTIKGLFFQYLPGVTIQPVLLDWFQENISALGMSQEGQSSQLIMLFKQFLEGSLLLLFTKIGEANQDMMTRLKSLAEQAAPGENQSAEEAAHHLIEQILEEISHNHLMQDLDFIPVALQKLAWDKIKEHAYQQLTPIFLPIVKRNQNRASLQEKSGSDLSGQLIEAFSKDAFKLLFQQFQRDKTIAKKIITLIPNLDSELQETLASQLQALFGENSNLYQAGTDFLSLYVEGVLLETLVAAEKKPQEAGKEIWKKVRGEQALEETIPQIPKVREEQALEERILQIPNDLMTQFFGIDSPDALVGVPNSWKPMFYQLIQEQLQEIQQQINKGITAFRSIKVKVPEMKEAMKQYGISDSKSNVEILSEDIANVAQVVVSQFLKEEIDGNLKVVDEVVEAAKSHLKDLANNGFKTAEVLLQYESNSKEILSELFRSLADEQKFTTEKQQAKNLMSDLLIVPLGQAIQKAIAFENSHQQELAQTLQDVTAEVLLIGAKHLQILKKAKQKAASDGRKDILHADFVEEAGQQLHSGVPKERGNENLNIQRQKEAYEPLNQALMQILSQAGLSKGLIWDSFKRDLLPKVVPMITESILDPVMLGNLAVNVLENVIETLNEEIVLEDSEPADQPQDALDSAAGEFAAAFLETLVLPDWMKKKIVDPETKQINIAMKKAMGAAMRRKLNATFIQDMIKISLEKAVTRDENGQPTISFDVRSQATKEAEVPQKIQEIRELFGKRVEQLPLASISYFIRSQWVLAQDRFDKLVAKTFGNIGMKFKHGLDAIFRVIFFKIIGNLLAVIFCPAKPIVLKFIYRMLALDLNSKIVLDIFMKVPSDQPEYSSKKHVVYNEQLVFEVIDQVVKRFMEEPVLPVSQEGDQVVVVEELGS